MNPYEIVNLTVFDSLEDYAYYIYYDKGLFDKLVELSYGVALAEAIDFQKVGEALKRYIEENPDDYRAKELYVTSDNKVVEHPDGLG